MNLPLNPFSHHGIDPEFVMHMVTPLIEREASRLRRNKARAEAKGLPVDLSLEQWLKLLNAWHWGCACCSDGRAETMEHIIPLAEGGGTTWENVVPACRKCNQRRDKYRQETRKLQRKLRQETRELKTEAWGINTTDEPEVEDWPYEE